jgi:hypothetical protein
MKKEKFPRIVWPDEIASAQPNESKRMYALVEKLWRYRELAALKEKGNLFQVVTCSTENPWNEMKELLTNTLAILEQKGEPTVKEAFLVSALELLDKYLEETVDTACRIDIPSLW